MTTIAPINHIEIVNDGFGSTEPVVIGTKLTVHEIAEMHIKGDTSVDTICELFELTPAQVHAALAYYFDHREDIDAEIQAADELTERLGKPLSDLLNN
jgi:uncharacterized protein (DUF433 family)